MSDGLGPGSTAPEATVVIATRDRPELLHRALESVLAQTRPNIEVVVVDDGSTDPVKIASEDPRVVLSRIETSRGACGARNVGLATAKGRWVTFLDDDDLLLPDMLERSLEAARGSRLPTPVAVLSGMEVVGPSGGRQELRMPTSLPRGKHYNLEDVEVENTANTLVVEADVLRRIGGWDDRIQGGWEHDDLLIRLNAVCSIQANEHVAYRMIEHPGIRQSRQYLQIADGMKRTVEKHRATFAMHRPRYARYLAAMAIYYLRAGRWWPGLRAATRALGVWPFRARTWRYWVASLLGPGGLRLWQRIKR